MGHGCALNEVTLNKVEMIISNQPGNMQGLHPTELVGKAIWWARGKNLIGPIYATLSRVNISQLESSTAEALKCFRTLAKILGERTTHYCELIVNLPGFIGYCDMHPSLRLVVPGSLGGQFTFHPVIWHFK
jgi:hypothetical protein